MKNNYSIESILIYYCSRERSEESNRNSQQRGVIENHTDQYQRHDYSIGSGGSTRDES